MDKLLEANIYSKVINEYLPKYQYDNVHKNVLTKNIPNNYYSFQTIQPEDGNKLIPNGNTKYKFIIKNKTGFLKNMVLKSYLTTAGDNTNAPTYLGALLWSDISFKQGGKEFWYHGRGYILGRLAELKDDKFNDILNTIQDPNFNANTVTIYTPLYNFFTDSEAANLLLDFTKEITVEAKWANFSFNSALTDFRTELGITVQGFDVEYMSNFLGKTRELFGYNLLVMTNNESVGSTSSRFYIKFPALCNSMVCSGFFANGNVITFNKLRIYMGDLLAQELESKDFVYLGKTASRFYESILYYFGSHDRTGFYGGMDLSEGLLSVEVFYDALPSAATIELNLERYQFYSLNDSGVIIHENLIH